MRKTYRYRAKKLTGEALKGTVEAENSEQALQLLGRENHAVLELKEDESLLNLLKDKVANLLHLLGLRTANSRTLMIFCRQFATMLDAGIPVMQCLKILSEQQELSAVSKELQQVSAAIEEGNSLAEALNHRRRTFPTMMASMVEAGEAGGVLALIMDKLADHYENQHDFNEKLRSATLYPLFITSLAFIVMAVMVVFVLPQFAQVFNSLGIEMPRFTRFLLSFSNLGRSSILLSLLTLLTPLLSFFLLLQSEKGKFYFDLLRLKTPFFGKIYRQALAARFARTLSTLLNSGVPLHRGLELVDRVINNKVISGSLTKIQESLNRGERMHEAMQDIIFLPSLLTEMVRIGEESGSLDQTLDKTAQFYEREVAYVIERLSSILEPLLLLIVGLFIGVLVFSIISPMYSVFQMI